METTRVTKWRPSGDKLETKGRQIERRNMEEKWKAHPTRANIFIDQDK